MGSGTGYFDRESRYYKPLSVETWDDYTGSSAGDDWDSWTSWEGTPSLPFSYTSDYIDTNTIDFYNVLLKVGTGGYFTTTLERSLTEDSAGTPTNWITMGTYSSGDSVPGGEGRYFRVTITFNAPDSAGDFETQLQRFKSLALTATKKKVTETQSIPATDVSSKLPGSTGNRIFVPSTIGNITNAQITLRTPVDQIYMQADYVVDSGSAGTDDYVQGSTAPQRPVVYMDYTSGTNTLNIDVYDLNSFSKSVRVDVGMDLRIEGLPLLEVDEHGNIVGV